MKLSQKYIFVFLIFLVSSHSPKKVLESSRSLSNVYTLTIPKMKTQKEYNKCLVGIIIVFI